MRNFVRVGISILSLAFAACSNGNPNTFAGWKKANVPEQGMAWPEGQAFPQFAAPSDTLDAIFYDDKSLSDGDVLMLSTLQGVVNSIKPRIYFLSHRRGGRTEWVDRIGLDIREIPIDNRYELVKKYASEVKGAVVYSTEKSEHYINLATTAAGLHRAVALTDRQLAALDSIGIKLEIVEDLRELPYTETTDIYRYMYDTYWKKCTRRTLLSLTPAAQGDIRDMAVAVKSAIVWLDPREENERAVLEPFLEELVPGESVMLGWWHEERAGIGIGAKHGISTIPSDYYNNATVYGGAPHVAHQASVPKRPALEDKVYVALFLSDGDNVQYCEHTLCHHWDNKERGTFPINWTISPSLVDLGPQLLNYYYETATDNDCLVSGPSGMGYAMFYDDLNHLWNADDRATIEPYAKLSQKYFEKSGIRVVTIWDSISDEQMDAYAENCRYTYGATLEDWKVGPKFPITIKNNRLAFIPNRPCYTGMVQDVFNEWRDTISTFNGSHPVFLTAQCESWYIGPQQMAQLQAMFDEVAPGSVQICRADHFFSYFNEANAMDFNLMMMESVDVQASASQANAALLADGSSSQEHCWIADQKGPQTITIDLHQNYIIDRYVVRHAGYANLASELNTRKFTVETSLDGENWTIADTQPNNRADVSDIDITATEARYVRISVLDPGKDGIARIGDIEIYGSNQRNV